MSEEFSGQTTRVRSSGALAASSSVPLTWLSSTARRSALNSSPACGTLPWTKPTDTSRPSVGSGIARGASATRPTASSPATVARVKERSTAAVTATRSRVPTTATAKPTPGAPSHRATWASGLSAWLNASLAHGNPP